MSDDDETEASGQPSTVVPFPPRRAPTSNNPFGFTATDLLRELTECGDMDRLIELGRQIRWG